jgi:hypothetical protein
MEIKIPTRIQSTFYWSVKSQNMIKGYSRERGRERERERDLKLKNDN